MLGKSTICFFFNKVPFIELFPTTEYCVNSWYRVALTILFGIRFLKKSDTISYIERSVLTNVAVELVCVIKSLVTKSLNVNEPTKPIIDALIILKTAINKQLILILALFFMLYEDVDVITPKNITGKISNCSERINNAPGNLNHDTTSEFSFEVNLNARPIAKPIIIPIVIAISIKFDFKSFFRNCLFIIMLYFETKQI